MPAGTSGEIKTRYIRQKQKNGDIYVIERKTQYDPERKCNRVLSSRVVEKIPKGKESTASSRQRRQETETAPGASSPSSDRGADRPTVHVESMAMGILEQIGKSSGIDQEIRDNTDPETADKIISLARFMTLTNGQDTLFFPGWKETHPVPWKESLGYEACDALFEQVGRDEAMMRGFFSSRMASIPSRAPLLAYDTQVIPEAQNLVWGGYGDPETIRMLTVYCTESMQPMCFVKQSPNLTDAGSIRNALKQLRIPGASIVEIVTDRGRFSEGTMAELFQRHLDFITPADLSFPWVREELDRRFEEILIADGVAPFDPDTRCLTVPLTWEFTAPGPDGSEETPPSGGGRQKPIRREIQLHLYFNEEWKDQQDTTFDRDLAELKRLVEEGVPPESLSRDAREKLDRYLLIRRRGKNTTVSYLEEAVAEAKKYHGYFALVSTRDHEASDCMLIYRRRETVNFIFQYMNQEVDALDFVSHHDDNLAGRMFIKFIALCYSEWLHQRMITADIDLPNEIYDEPDEDEDDDFDDEDEDDQDDEAEDEMYDAALTASVELKVTRRFPIYILLHQIDKPMDI